MEGKEVNKVNGLLLDASYFNENDVSKIKLYVKTEKGIEFFADPEFRPYIYAKAIDAEKAKKELNESALSTENKIIRVEKAKKENQENIIKITFNSTAELVKNREFLLETKTINELFESDILYPKRYLLDKNLTPMNKVEISFEEINGIKWIKSIKEIPLEDSINELKLMAFDLETFSGEGFSNPERDPILTISAVTEKKSICFSYKKEFAGAKDLILAKNEKEMIEKFLEFTNEFAPDVIVTYNGDGFDFPYIKERAKQLKVKLEFGPEKMEPVTKRVSLFTAEKIKGLQHLDAFQMVKFLIRIAAINSPKMDLETVTESVFGKKKEKVPAEEINEIWKTGKNAERLVKYNIEDSYYTLELAKRFLPLIIEIAKLTKQTIFDASRASSSQNVESALMIECVKRNELIPNKPSEGEVNKRNLAPIKGGYVKEPTAGLHENIAVMDFRSLYPSIIISHNVSPETLNCEHGKCMNGANVSPEGDCFCAEKKGLVPTVLETVLEKRIEAKKLMKKESDPEKKKILEAKQHALKILLNSTYGTLVFPRFRWYSRECGKSITAWARKYIQDVLSEAEKQGFTPLYSDTDSAHLIVPKEKTLEDVKKFLEFINNKLPGAMELEFEGYYKRGIFVTKKDGGAAKKRYALIDFNGKMKITGFEFVRRDWSRIAKRTQGKALELILKEGNPTKAIELVKKTIEEIRSGKAKKEDLIIFTRLTRPLAKYENTGPHILAAKDAIAKGKKISTGTTIEFIITKNGKSISEKAKLAEYVSEGDYDKDYYIDHQIIPSVQRIIEELGYSKEDLLIGGKQKNLFSFE